MTQIIYTNDTIIASHKDDQDIDIITMYPSATGIKYVANDVLITDEIEVEITPEITQKNIEFKAVSELSESTDQKWEAIRAKRDKLLPNSDKTRNGDIFDALESNDKTELDTYREDLRNLPDTYSSDPDSVVWPTVPTFLV